MRSLSCALLRTAGEFISQCIQEGQIVLAHEVFILLRYDRPEQLRQIMAAFRKGDEQG